MRNLPAKSTASRDLEKLTPLQLYLQEVARYPLLSPEEEYELAVRQFEEGDVKAAHRLITSNLRLVVKIANEFKQKRLNTLDLIQEGNYGLMQAVKKFNPYKGVKLSSYSAWWIKAFILKYIMENASQVKMGTTAAQRKLFFNLRKEAEKLLASGQSFNPKLIAESLDVPEKDVVEMHKRLNAPDISIETPLGASDESKTIGDTIAGGSDSIEELLADRQVKTIFANHLDEFKQSLEGRDREIFEARMVSETPLTLQEIGDRYGVSRERARQIEARIVKKLKAFVVDKGTLDI